jgi:hypothetical protein
MESKDGSMGFDFAGTYTNIVNRKLIEYSFGDRAAQIEFADSPKGVRVRVTSTVSQLIRSNNSATDGRPFLTTSLAMLSKPVISRGGNSSQRRVQRQLAERRFAALLLAG